MASRPASSGGAQGQAAPPAAREGWARVEAAGARPALRWRAGASRPSGGARVPGLPSGGARGLGPPGGAARHIFSDFFLNL